MDYLSVQQRREALDDRIWRAIRCFEKETEEAVSEITVHRLDGACTSILTKTIGVYHDRS